MKKILLVISMLLNIHLYADSNNEELASNNSSNMLTASVYTLVNELYTQRCENQEMDGCYELGVLYGEGKGVDKNITKANELWAKACDAGHAEGCFKLGTSYQRGRGVKRDSDIADKLWVKACNKGNAEACYNHAELVSQGHPSYEDFFEPYKKACDGGIAEACLIASPLYKNNNYYNKNNNNKLIPREQYMANKRYRENLFIKACTLGSAKGCYRAATSIRHLSVDEKLAYAILSCDGGDSYGCTEAATVYGNYKHNMPKQLEFSKKACDFNYGSGNQCRFYRQLLDLVKKGVLK